jgi:hypothetical protein
MMATAGLALRQLGRLDVNPYPISQLDDLLLFACLPSFFIYGISSLVPAMAYSNYISIIIISIILILISLTGLPDLTCEQAFELSDASAERSAAGCTIKLN